MCKTPVNKPTPNFLQAGCPSCHPINSVRALKWKLVSEYAVILLMLVLVTCQCDLCHPPRQQSSCFVFLWLCNCLLATAPIIVIWTDLFSWYFWQRFLRFLACPGTPSPKCLSMSVCIRGIPRAFHTAVAAALPATHRSNHESLAQSWPMCSCCLACDTPV